MRFTLCLYLYVFISKSLGFTTWSCLLILVNLLILQEDEDGHLVVLQIIQDLTIKAQEIFLDHFARLGVFSKVLQLAGPQDVNAVVVKKQETNVSETFYLFLSPLH